MRGRTLLILSALVAALLAFILLYERKLPSSEERATHQKRVFGGLEVADVLGLTIEVGGAKVVLERESPPAAEGGEQRESGTDAGEAQVRWHLREPLAARADRFAVDGLVRTLVELAKERTLEGVARPEVGLDRPRAQVVVKTRGGERRLEVGGEVPAGNSVVVALDGGAVFFVAPKAFVTDLEKPAGEWRARDLFPGSRERLERLTIESPAHGRLLLAKRGEAFWLESPVADRAEREAVDTLLADLTAVRAEAFVDAPPAGVDLGLAPPQGLFEAVLKGEGRPFRVELGRPAAAAGRLYARVDGVLVEISDRLSQALAKPLADWRAKSWSSLETWQIDRVAVTAGGATVAFERKDGDWHRGADKLGFQPVSELLYAIADLKAERLGSAAEAEARGHALGTARLAVKLAGAAGIEEELSLFDERDGLVAATSQGREAVLLLPAGKVAEFEAKLEAARIAPIDRPTPQPSPTPTPPSP